MNSACAEPQRLGWMPEGPFNAYEPVAPIASGGMAKVFLCRKLGIRGFHRLFALKVMHPHIAEQSQCVSMFLDEARLAARLHHPNVVSILDLGVSRNDYYLVMDYVEGGSLAELLASRTDLLSRKSVLEARLALVSTIALDVLQGLSAAHEQRDYQGRSLNLIHRDVSPHNILVGLDGHARLTDFGIAKAEARVTVTQPGTRKGKIEYMAPEQLCGEHHVTPASDLFSLGVVLWNAFTGERLFHGENDVIVMQNVLAKTIVPPATRFPGLPRSISDVIMRALSREASERHQSAAEMHEDLFQAVESSGLLARRKDISAWVRHECRDKLAERRALVAVAELSYEEEPTSPGGSVGHLEDETLPSSAPGMMSEIHRALRHLGSPEDEEHSQSKRPEDVRTAPFRTRGSVHAKDPLTQCKTVRKRHVMPWQEMTRDERHFRVGFTMASVGVLLLALIPALA